jgi:HEPN domain-containing protein
MAKESDEWLRQADYDLETAEFMLNGGRYFYAVFMCHLAIEKALKGLYQERVKEVPPKVHNLIFLVEKIGLKIPPPLYDWIFFLNRVSVPTRYPDNLAKLQKDFGKEQSEQILLKSKEILKWLKEQS